MEYTPVFYLEVLLGSVAVEVLPYENINRLKAVRKWQHLFLFSGM